MSESIQSSSRQAVHNHIVEVANEQFRLHGIRSVRMDDLAATLGISKRTLYEEFADKEALLLAVNLRNQQEMEKLYQKFHEESDNVLEFMLKIFRFTMQLFAETNPKYFEEMQRYPSLKEEFLKSRQNHAHHIKQFVMDGIEQGIFRSDLNVELFLKTQDLMHDRGLQDLKKQYGLTETLKTTLLVTLRGISTLKGVSMIDEFIEELRKQ
ncbi:MAG: TetR/AcrR family transcriptional regulator [Bacteroidaceae bacterium]|nr:TetR/AcrR family transcriptional regulator [Bacteroidaceae bacterium]